MVNQASLKRGHVKEGREWNLDCSKFKIGLTRNDKFNRKATEITLELGIALRM